ncbi:MAG: HAD family hydrolase [Lentisphaerae bacterium]|nr:HAD family hydrolase [Lentisphaerota bacterium]
MKRCVFFDRDGIVNRFVSEGYVEHWGEFKLLPEFPAALRLVQAAGYDAVIVTNQRGVALGVMSRESVEDIHRRLADLLRSVHGLDLLDIVYCPHDEGTCECRKPRPGMLLEAAKRHGIDLHASWMIGDHERDVEAGKRAGCRCVLVGDDVGETAADHTVASMAGLCDLLEGLLKIDDQT